MEIIRPRKERSKSKEEVFIISDFQEQNPREFNSIPINQVMTAEDIFKNPKLQQKDLHAELFEEKFQEIDQYIGILDPTPELSFKNIQAIGKENFLESFSINDVEKGRIQTHAHALPCQPRLPLSVLPDALNVPGSNEGTWKRISKSCVGTDVVMEEAMGTKRTT